MHRPDQGDKEDKIIRKNPTFKIRSKEIEEPIKELDRDDPLFDGFITKHFRDRQE